MCDVLVPPGMKMGQKGAKIQIHIRFVFFKISLVNVRKIVNFPYHFPYDIFLETFAHSCKS